ncbi:MAG: BON domain-containing protein [Methylomonas sp.]|jgi:osmotically-inducible protein OsmY
MKRLLSIFPAFVLALSLLSAAGCASTAKSEGTGEYVDDSVITTKIKAQLFDEPDLKSGQITVESYKGIVMLSGFLSSQADINKAVRIARETTGVKSVKNEMRLR